MTDTIRLLRLIDESGIPKAEISRRMGFKSPTTLQNKIHNRYEFTQSEIESISRILGITRPADIKAIFLCPNVHKT